MYTFFIKKLRACHQIQSHLSEDLIRTFSSQLFSGLAYLHSKSIVHRDIKPANLLVNMATKSLIICDLGTAKKFSTDQMSVSYVGSRFYRAPELLIGSRKYKAAIDIWSAGCVIAEMLLDCPLFQGNDNIDQLVEIIRVLGYPTKEDLDSFDSTDVIPKKIKKLSSLAIILPMKIDPDLFKLLESIFVYNPNHRPTARECLNSPYFSKYNDLIAENNQS